MDAGTNNVPGSGTCHSRRSTLVKNEAVAAAYLRAAHAYMLISMPTETSTIFGVFQAILALHSKSDDIRPPYNLASNQKFASEIFGGKSVTFLCCSAR